MAITKAKKSELIEKFDRILKDAVTTVFVGFKGITVADTTLMRRALRDAGIGYTVVKKTLLERALKARGYKGELPALPGEVAMVYGKDAVAPAREIAVYAKKHGGNLSLLGGIFEGAFRDKAGIITIASIPSLHVLYGQFANVINSPIQGLAVALSEVAKKKGN